MINLLRSVISNLYYPLSNRGNWQGMFIDYEKPNVERLWTQMTVDGQDVRVFLHKIHPCTTEEAFYHPHPWPSAMLICKGQYESGIGFGHPDDEPPQKLGPFLFQQWTAYQMTDPREWHYVRPIGEPCMTLMVTGTKFPSRQIPKEKLKHRDLTKKEFESILDFFSDPTTRNKMLTVLDSWQKI